MIIGIGGVSRAGKTTLANLLAERYNATDKTTCVVSQDDFVNPESKLLLIKNKIDWEDPKSINYKKYISKLKKLNKVYAIVIAEGLFAFYDETLIKLYDKKVFINISKEVFVERKENDLRWGSAAEPKWYIEHIWKSYKKYGESNIPGDSIMLSGEERFDIKAISAKLLEVSNTEVEFNKIADQLSKRNIAVERGPMMTAKGIRYKNKNFAFYHKDEMTFKLGKDFDAIANGIEKIRYLSPFKNKPPMKAWYIVPPNQMDIWSNLAEIALEKIRKELE